MAFTYLVQLGLSTEWEIKEIGEFFFFFFLFFFSWCFMSMCNSLGYDRPILSSRSSLVWSSFCYHFCAFSLQFICGLQVSPPLFFYCLISKMISPSWSFLLYHSSSFSLARSLLPNSLPFKNFSTGPAARSFAINRLTISSPAGAAN